MSIVGRKNRSALESDVTSSQIIAGEAGFPGLRRFNSSRQKTAAVTTASPAATVAGVARAAVMVLGPARVALLHLTPLTKL